MASVSGRGRRLEYYSHTRVWVWYSARHLALDTHDSLIGRRVTAMPILRDELVESV
jgi:hypothetical protein